MHGTGTQAGDGTEMVSVTNVFAPADRKRPSDRPLYLGAVKSNVGHGEAASGVTALIKVLMMLQKNAIPPRVGIKKEINQGFPTDLSDRNVNIAFHLDAVYKNGRQAAEDLCQQLQCRWREHRPVARGSAKERACEV